MGDNVFLVSGHVMNITDAAGLTAVAAGVTGTTPWRPKGGPYSCYQAVVSGTGTVTATVVIDVSNDGVNACDTVMGTITLTGTTSDSDGFVSQGASWKYVRARLTAISGTNASVAVISGI